MAMFFLRTRGRERDDGVMRELAVLWMSHSVQSHSAEHCSNRTKCVAMHDSQKVWNHLHDHLAPRKLH